MPTNVDFTLYDPNVDTPLDLVNTISGNLTGIAIDPESIALQAPLGSTSFFTSLNLGSIGTQSFRFDQPGILITTGEGAPPSSNTQPSFTVSHNAPGDPELDAIATEAFPGAGATFDAVILEFSFTVTNPDVKGIGFDVMFGSEEYPVFVNSSYVDIAAITINGQNIAFIDGDPSKPLSIVGATVDDGRFFDNRFDSIEPSPLAIEYNGITPKLFLPFAFTSEDIYTVRIGIADTGDTVLDSGMFISNFRALGSEIENPLVVVEAGPDGDTLVPTGPSTPTYFLGGIGNDIMTGGLGADVFDLTKGGFNTIKATPEQLNNDLIIGFTSNDQITLLDAFIEQDQLTVTQGSAILSIDATNDGQPDTTITLQGDFPGAFLVSVDEAGSIITFDPVFGRPPEYGVAERIMEIYSSVWGAAPDPQGLDYWVAQINMGNLTYVDTVASFFDQPLVQGRYGDAVGEELLLALYQNIFRIPEPDEDGLAYWKGIIADDPSLLEENIGTLVMQMIDGMWDNNLQLALNAQSLFKNFVSTSSSFVQQLRQSEFPDFDALSPENQDEFLDAARELTANLTAGSTPIDMEGLVAQALAKVEAFLPQNNPTPDEFEIISVEMGSLFTEDGTFTEYGSFGGDGFGAEIEVVGPMSPEDCVCV